MCQSIRHCALENDVPHGNYERKNNNIFLFIFAPMLCYLLRVGFDLCVDFLVYKFFLVFLEVLNTMYITEFLITSLGAS